MLGGGGDGGGGGGGGVGGENMVMVMVKAIMISMIKSYMPCSTSLRSRPERILLSL